MSALSLALHGAVLAVAQLRGVGWHAGAPRAAPDPASSARRAPLPTPSCEADVALATAARLVYCATPLGAGEGCARASMDEMSLGFTTCDAVALSTDVALVPPETVEHIEPEPLVEFMEPEEVKELEQAQPEPAAEPPPPPPAPPERPQQVVEITQPSEETPPDSARFLAEYDSRVDKETVARGSTEPMVEAPQQPELTPTPDPREAAMSDPPDAPEEPSANPDNPEGPGELAMRAPGSTEPAELPQEAHTPGVAEGADAPATDQGLEAARGDGDVFEEAKDATTMQGEGGGGGGRPQVPDLRPTEDVLERAVGGGSVDKLDGVAQGETTALNARRWKYATFFNRMKRRVAQNWHPAQAYRRRDPSGNVYGSKNRVTYVQVSLSPRGEVTKIYVIKSSGVDFLDEEAVRAFRAAQPFPNPPRGLVDPRSRLITFTFGFHFEIGRRGRWKIFRHR